MSRHSILKFRKQSCLLVLTLVITALVLSGCGFELPQVQQAEFDRFDLSDITPASNPTRPLGEQITPYAIEYVTDLGIADDQPGHDSEVRVVLPRSMPNKKVPALVVNGAGAFLFSGMILSDEDIEPLLPYVEQGFAIVAYETDGCQPDFSREPSGAEISQMTRQYVASKAGLVNAQHALSYALERFPEIDADQLYAIGHSSGGKQALLLASHDERIRGCVAFAPACQMDFGSAMTIARVGGPDASFLASEVNRSMPIVHAKVTKVPMLLVYSPNDRVTRPAEVLTYAKAVGEVAEAFPVECGGHGQVPEAGFDRALTWLRAQYERHHDEPSATTLVSKPSERQMEFADSAEVEDSVKVEVSAEVEVSVDPTDDGEPAERLTGEEDAETEHAETEVAPPRSLNPPVRSTPSADKNQEPWRIRSNPFFTE